MSSFLSRWDERESRLPKKLRKYSEQYHIHGISTKILSRESIDCTSLHLQLQDPLKQEIDQLSPSLEASFVHDDAEMFSSDPDIVSGSNEGGSDDEIDRRKLQAQARSPTKRASLAYPPSPTAPRTSSSRRYTVSSAKRPHNNNDLPLVDPLPGLLRNLDQFEEYGENIKSQLEQHREEQSLLKEKIMALMEDANGIQDYNETTIEQVCSLTIRSSEKRLTSSADIELIRRDAFEGATAIDT